MIPFVVTQNSAVNLSNGVSVVVLKVGEVKVNFPIVMTPFDGKCVISMAAGMEFCDQAFPNVVGRLLDEFGVSLEKIAIVTGTIEDPVGGQEEPTSVPVMYLRQGEKEVAIIAFAGDAISLALARNAPMFIEEEAFVRDISNEKVKDLLTMIEEAVPEALEG